VAVEQVQKEVAHPLTPIIEHLLVVAVVVAVDMVRTIYLLHQFQDQLQLQ
jgi:hypothetical protein